MDRTILALERPDMHPIGMNILFAVLLWCGRAQAESVYAPTKAQMQEIDRLMDQHRRPGAPALVLEVDAVKNGASYVALALQTGVLIPGCDPFTETYCFATEWSLTVDSPGDAPGETRQIRWHFYPDRANRSEDIKLAGHIARQIEYSRERSIRDPDVIEASALALDLLLNPPNGYNEAPFPFEH